MRRKQSRVEERSKIKPGTETWKSKSTESKDQKEAKVREWEHDRGRGRLYLSFGIFGVSGKLRMAIDGLAS